MQQSVSAKQGPPQSYWFGMIAGSVPFFLSVAAFLVAYLTVSFSFDQSVRLVIFVYGAGALATVACVLIKRFHSFGAGMFTSLFFSPVALLALGFIAAMMVGSVA